ncbi:alcohol acetyltransferase [Brachybacterium sp. MASK1Z-5]|uniref:Alcohol acetyltransferase n=1 Tax=Brachybacterium halotolerans TaxID=2795215 RepID=A0ABS1B6T9_9MICO|nr:alcohol acetyltransferase [Brachybacterium halotolerans]MBK0330336.1 alcohol acetyltransferase [Brachybacterium halotolerans]
MSRRTWVRLDNASNIFLAARTESDTKVFRLSAEMDAEVDPGVLQEALDAVFELYPLYRAVLRRGVFWYYLQDSDLRPVVEPERRPSCAPIYQDGRRTLLFRVIHHRRRISLEVFHALSDGTGAMWFLTDLLVEYARRRYPADAAGAAGAPGTTDGAETPRAPAAAAAGDSPSSHALETDSFAHYFRRRRPTAFEEAFAEAAAPAALTLAEKTVRAAGSTGGIPTSASPAPSDAVPAGPARRTRIHRVRGTRTPDDRTRAVELTMPTAQLLALSKAAGASPTMYLTALFMDAVRESSGGLGRARTLSASVPVNLRQFFPSTSARNFFATIRVEHTFSPDGSDGRDGSVGPDGPDSPEAVARALEAEFRPQASAAALAPKVARFIRVERSPLLRIVPRPLKDLILGWLNAASNRHLSLAVSNLGRLRLPEPAASHVGRVLFQVSAARPQFCAISHGEQMTVTFTSPFTQTGHVRAFARSLSARGIDVSVTAARVTEAELAEVAP